MKDGSIVAGEKAAADAHPNGARPWRWENYVEKFDALTADALPRADRDLFLSAVQRLPQLPPADLFALVPALPEGAVEVTRPTGAGIFDYGLER
jgi:2-methylcitrate dehydratase